jgi:ABC-type multidrug transport system fused ATPase/permease subunit
MRTNLQTRFRDEARNRLDANASAFLKGQLLNRWLGVRLDLGASALITVVALASTLAQGALSPGLVGLILSYSQTLTGLLNFTARNFADTETALASVERMVKYSQVRKGGSGGGVRHCSPRTHLSPPSR